MEEGAKNRRRSVEDYLRLLECIVLKHFFFKANCECRVLFTCSNVFFQRCYDRLRDPKLKGNCYRAPLASNLRLASFFVCSNIRTL